MANDFEKILDACIDRLNSGERPEACLKDYPEYAAELEPLLRTVADTKATYEFTPSVDSKRLARQRFYDAMEKKKQPAGWFRRPLAWGSLTAVLAILIIGYFALRATVLPVGMPAVTTTIPGPAANGNFVFLVSDDVNAISDFSSLYVTIEKVGMHLSDNTDRLIEFVPETKTFDLSQLPGDKTQQLWRGDVPAGTYTKVVIEVSEVRGTLVTGETLTIKLPSNRLQLSKSFEVGTDTVTSFTYDLTVIKAGNEKNSKYILKPQIGESSVTTQPAEQSNQDNGKKKDKSTK